MGTTFDVAILGGGQAGGLLARQLRRHVPEASVLLVEKERERSFKVGESTVDVCGHYLTNRLGLGPYLAEHHLRKNGLRFFFDREDRSARLEELSEIGAASQIPFPSFQLDRARFEEDLLRMNAEDGVDVRIGVRASAVTLAHPGAPHTIALEEEGASAGEARARWVIDATGRSSVLARQRSLRVKAPLTNAGVWGRFRNVVDLDDVGPSEFRQRMRGASRTLSTNHFCYPGYWIWLIPLGRGVTSVGVVMRREQLDPAMRTGAGLLAFLRSHRAVADLMVHAELVDVMSLGQLAYGTSRFFDASERWGLIGEAAAFTDPLYSPGGDYIALENDWMTDLVRRDLAGERDADIVRRADAYDRCAALRYESTLMLYEGLYGTLGSFDVFSSKWDFDVACYLNLWVEPYFLDRHLDLPTVTRELESRAAILGCLSTFRHAFLEAEATLRREGRFFENNLGHARMDPATRLVPAGFATMESHRRALPRVRDAMQLAWGELQQKLGRPASKEPIPYARFALGRPLG